MKVFKRSVWVLISVFLILLFYSINGSSVDNDAERRLDKQLSGY